MEDDRDWAELSGEDANLRLNFGLTDGQSRFGTLEFRIDTLSSEGVGIYFTNVEAFELQVRSLADHSVGTTAILNDLYTDFSLEIKRTRSDTFAASVNLTSKQVAQYELRGTFEADNIALQKFASGLRRLLEKLKT